MLEEGMRVKVGDKKADAFAYKQIVGHYGTIIKVHNGHATVNIDGNGYGNWYVQDIDCIPTDFKNNKMASMLLEKEW